MPDSRFFTSSGPYTLGELVERCGGQLSSSDAVDLSVTSVASIEAASSEDVTFLSNSKYVPSLATSNAAACVLEQKYADHAPENMALIISDNPYLTYAKIAALIYPSASATSGISPQAVIDDTATIPDNCTIGAYAVIEKDVVLGEHTVVGAGSYIASHVQIGESCVIHPSVTISHSIIGDRVEIFSGARIGQDGFGFATDQGVHVSVPQLGRVVIHNDASIGANSCIDRGAGPDTVIGEGCRIDNLVQIGHNVTLGKGAVIVSQVGISGSTKVGNYAVLGGQVGVAGHLHIGDMSQIAAQAGVAQDVKAGEILGGSPAVPIKQWHRQTIALKKLVSKYKKGE